MKRIPIELTPAQQAFAEKNIAGFMQGNWHIELAGEAGSQRRFIRLRSSKSDDIPLIMVVWESADPDWLRFLAIERALRHQGGVVPEVFAHDETHGLILEEDLGDTTLHVFSSRYSSFTSDVEAIYNRAIDTLIAWQSIPVNFCEAINERTLDLEMFLWETGYFSQHCVAEFFGCESLITAKWDAERRHLAQACAQMPLVTIHRDFQSENVLVHNARIRFVDFQGARKGPAGYDLASLLYDPYIDFFDEQSAKKLLSYYQSVASHKVTVKDFHLCAAQRLMQALGAYGNLSLHKGKERYRVFMRPALERLCEVLKQLPEYPALLIAAHACLEKSSQ